MPPELSVICIKTKGVRLLHTLGWTLSAELLPARRDRVALATIPYPMRYVPARYQVFMQDVKNLLSMTDMWKSRAAPVPLEFESIMAVPNGDSVILGDGNVPANADSNVNGKVGANANGHATRTSMGLKDQKSLTLRETVEIFIVVVVVGTGLARIWLCFSSVYSTNRLSSRLSRPKEEGGEEMISFDKDDDDTLDFVCAAANLRSIVYGIGGKTRWEVKEMAGNIIPAIATTNAIIAGLIVLQALHLLRAHQPSTSTSTLSASAPSATAPTTTSTSTSPDPSLRTIHLQHKPAVPLQPTRPEPPNRTCVNLALKRGIECNNDGNVEAEDEDEFGGGYEPPDAEVSVYEDKRILADPDFDDIWGRTLEDLGCGRGKFITIVDEEREGEGGGDGGGGGGGWGTLAVAVGLLPDDHPADGPAVLLIEPVRRAQRRTKTEGKAAARPSTPTIGSKRPAESGDHDRDRAKRPRTDAQAVPMSSPSKGYKEVDGVVIIEDDVDDVIVIDD
ncbi:repeat in ubiquitin-activating protein-domain-containing protein [Hysterangium stoloniferum]|nr:repeat in ubiquitin-activating protein-domain-containing protein [Hysterangium stoloniferum]